MNISIHIYYREILFFYVRYIPHKAVEWISSFFLIKHAFKQYFENYTLVNI